MSTLLSTVSGVGKVRQRPGTIIATGTSPFGQIVEQATSLRYCRHSPGDCIDAATRSPARRVLVTVVTDPSK
jgi:hypothetical protein